MTNNLLMNQYYRIISGYSHKVLNVYRHKVHTKYIYTLLVQGIVTLYYILSIYPSVHKHLILTLFEAHIVYTFIYFIWRTKLFKLLHVS